VAPAATKGFSAIRGRETNLPIANPANVEIAIARAQK
jgi:hypothetical protein